ncbi:MAG TPA: single-stranded-DNA-specific exonuclease RecJ [Eggerthellaceae bacterium]|nr:single-stranded-DNA-specific exonuclease RecJ [Eggerthellaceae bacterium]
MSAQFKVHAADARAVAYLRERFELPEFIATIMAARNICTEEQANRFLNPSLDRDWLNPYEMPGIGPVVDALEQAIRDRRHIVVYGDFDVDGVSATTVLTRGLRALGGYATPFIPRRFEEGYALSEAAYRRVKQLKPELIVTVDCGIACKDEIEAIVADGVGVVVTDHHEPSEQCPEGIPLVDPKTDPACPSSVLAGVGVALKVVQALGGRFGYPHLWRSYTDLATLGTVADLMPMRDENRALVADGLARINANPRPCLAALLGQAGSAGKQISATDLSFSLIPRLNAAGRLGDAQGALDLLMTDDFDTACKLAAELEATNDKRRAIESELSEVARAKAGEVYRGQRALVVAGEGWHEGVKGIVASRLVHTYGVPCLLFTIDGDEARGSGRTVGQVNLFKAVESASDLLTRFGGHEAAVGVTLPASKLDEFAERLCAYMDALPDDDFHPLVEIDACVSLDELTIENVQKLQALAPFGQENRVPCLLARDVMLANARAVGAEKNHFSCTLSNGHASVAGIMFHCTDIELLMRTSSLVNAAFEVQIDEWRGKRSVKAMLKSLSPAQSCAALEACLDPGNLRFVSDLYATSDEELCEAQPESPLDVEAYEADCASNRETWRRRAATHPAELEDEIVRALIGDGTLHPEQQEVLNHLDAGRSTMCVMATGRGKSLIFQVHAAKLALRERKASLFVYPLRALIADQSFHLNNALSRFGIVSSVLTGESSPEERRAIYDALAQGECDIVLTTPEFLTIHADKLAASGRIAFVVVDEAHHIGMAKAGQRLAYKSLGTVVRQLGDPTVLALTATASGDVARDIATALPLSTCVFDRTDRPNLEVDDRRGLKTRESYLANLIAGGEKTVVYVNSRESSVQLARILRQKVPQIALMIGFYNAALSRGERARIEEMFRLGQLTVLVATSAFGEGVNIPDIRHVVLYHLPYNEIEFNQMSGRAGRDGALAGVHLLYTSKDAEVNERILSDMTPDRNRMAQVYRALRDAQRESGEGFFTASNVDVAKRASQRGGAVSQDSARCAISVFRELGLVETHTAYTSGEMVRSVRVVAGADKVELESSVRYREGLDEQAVFQDFKQWALREDARALQLRVQSPILPACGTV